MQIAQQNKLQETKTPLNNERTITLIKLTQSVLLGRCYIILKLLLLFELSEREAWTCGLESNLGTLTYKVNFLSNKLSWPTIRRHLLAQISFLSKGIWSIIQIEQRNKLLRPETLLNNGRKNLSRVSYPSRLVDGLGWLK